MKCTYRHLIKLTQIPEQPRDSLRKEMRSTLKKQQMDAIAM